MFVSLGRGIKTSPKYKSICHCQKSAIPLPSRQKEVAADQKLQQRAASGSGRQSLCALGLLYSDYLAFCKRNEL